jgi:hypothetical protein
MKFTDVPIPPRMQQLPRDPRGYPIPATVLVTAGRPHFTINDEATRQRLISEDRCPICGQRINGVRWFVGGPLSAFHLRGRYIDPPMHDECAHYALQVCPYLAAPNYSGRLDARTLSADDRMPVLIDPTMIPERPQLFVAVLALKQRFTVIPKTKHVLYIAPKRPYLRVEYWRHGERVDDAEGQATCDFIMGVPILELKPPRLRVV